MAKIQITHPQSTAGTPLYGSQREHRSYVCIKIRMDNGGDHLKSLGDAGDDTGFKGAHESVMKRVRYRYDHRKPSLSRKDRRDPKTGFYEIGEALGSELVDAPELGNGGEVVEVAMSFEQFAEMLVSTGHMIDCTVMGLRGVGNPGAYYQEEVTPPPSIYDRAQRRMQKAQDEALAHIDRGLEEIAEMKATQKVKDTMSSRLRMIRQAIVENAGFVMKQAGEEMGAMSEGAVSIIYDKVGGLEAEGRLPPGSLEQFRSGGAKRLLGASQGGEAGQH